MDTLLASRNDIALRCLQEIIVCITLFFVLVNDGGLRYSGKLHIWMNYAIHFVFKACRIALLGYVCWYVIPDLFQACLKNFLSSEFKLAKHNAKILGKKIDQDTSMVNYILSLLMPPCLMFAIFADIAFV